MGQDTEARELLDRLRDGDRSARDRLHRAGRGAIRRLGPRHTSRTATPMSDAGSRPTTCSRAALCAYRVHRSLAQVHPEGVRHFDNLAAAQIRRELIDLARRYHGREGLGAHHHTDVAGPDGRLAQVAEPSRRPDSLEEWAAFHEAVERLPEEEQQIMDLLWYRGLTHAQAAEALGVAAKTVQRRWASARLMIRDAVGGEGPT